MRTPGLAFVLLAAVTTTTTLKASEPSVPASGHAELNVRSGGSTFAGMPPAYEAEVLEDTATEHVSSEVAAYSDSDHVTVFTPSVSAGVENVNGASLSGTYLVDAVSAASVDILSTASRGWQEVRQAGGLSAQYKPRDFGIGISGSVSSEPDYLSYGVFARVVKDFDQKNWTVFFGYGVSHDTIGRCGGMHDGCTPFSVFSRDLLRGSFNGGVDLVLDRVSTATLAADVVVENGDQSKPYRYVPMFDAATVPQVKKGASIDWVNEHRRDERPLEQLPLSRKRFALTAHYARQMGVSTLRVMERGYTDTWGVMASSTDVRWIFDLGRRFAVWPHVRFHVQKEATFWKLAYLSGKGWDLPLYRTGDRELGPLWTAQGGLGIKWYFGSRAEPQKWALQLTGDAMYTAFLDDLYVTNRIAALGALGFEGTF